MLSNSSLLLASVASSMLGAPPGPVGDVLLAAHFAPVTREDTSGNVFGVHGNVLPDMTGGPFGNPCAVFPASGNSGLTASGTTSDFNLGTNDWTIECWIAGNGSEPAAVVHFVCQWNTNSTNRSWSLDYDPATNLIRGRVTDSASSTIRVTSFAVSDPATFFDGTWHHIAMERNGTVITTYVDGVAGGTTYTIGTAQIRNSSSFFRTSIGAQSEYVPSLTFFGGSISEVRITRGSIRYGSAFTPPSAVFPRGAIDDAQWSDVLLLVGFGGTWGFNFAGTYGLTFADLSLPSASLSSTNVGHIDNAGFRPRNYSGTYTTGFTAGSGLHLAGDDFTFELFIANSGIGNTDFHGFNETSALAYYTSRVNTAGIGYRLNLSTNGTTVALESRGDDVSGSDTEQHYAFVREGNEVRAYRAGVLMDTDTFTGTLFDPTGSFFLMWRNASTGMALKAFRITKGVALYTGSSFTPPDAVDLLDPL